MAIKIFIICLFVSVNCFGQKGKPDTSINFKLPEVYIDGKSIYSQNTDNMPVIITFPKQKDSSKYYYQKYIKLKNKGVPDSINHWYYLLNKLKK